MAMALSLPSDFPSREMLIVTTFGVALFTLLVPGLTMEAVVRILRVSRPVGSRETQLRKELDGLDAEKENLLQMKKARAIGKKEYQEKLSEIEERGLDLGLLLEKAEQSAESDDCERLQIETALVRAQRECLIQLSKKEISKPSLIQEYRERLDSRHLELESR